MLTLPELLKQLQFIGYEPLLLGLFITASIILINQDWRFLILTLLAQYILIGFILSRLVRPDIAVLSILIGAFICPILFLSARQVSVSSLATVPVLDPEVSGYWQKFMAFVRGSSPTPETSSTGAMFRVFVALFSLLVTLTVSNSFPLPGLPILVTTAVYWLVLVGLMTLSLTENPLKAGFGLFTVLSGFGLLYTFLEQSLLLTGLWGSVSLLIALAIGYLTVVRGTGPEERR